MMSASLNHCKKMEAEPGRGLLKQPAAKLEPVIVVYVYWSTYFYDFSRTFCQKKFYISGSQSGRNHPLAGEFEGQEGDRTKGGNTGEQHKRRKNAQPLINR